MIDDIVQEVRSLLIFYFKLIFMLEDRRKVYCQKAFLGNIKLIL